MFSESYKEGYDAFIRCSGGTYGANTGQQYVGAVSEACQLFEDSINAFKGNAKQTKILKGDIAEFLHGETFNINAILKHSKYKVDVNRVTDFASPDISSNWEKVFGLKYCRDAQSTAKAQAQSTIEYNLQHGTSHEANNPYASIYQGQTRIVPAEQLKGIKDYLRDKIAKEELIRPEQVERYKETLERLSTKIKAPDGTESVEWTTEDAALIAELAKKGEFDAAEWGYSTEQLIKLEHIRNEGLQAGITAATISLVLKIAPEIWKCISQLADNGYIDEEQLRATGFAAISGATTGFCNGFIAASITTACKSGALGASLKSANPNVIAALTTIVTQTMYDSFLVVKGDLTQQELAWNLSRNIVVTGIGVGMGCLTQALLPAIPFAYMLGNFVGTFIGSFAYTATDNAIMSFCIDTGYTFFGLVEQDYTLPQEVLDELGVECFEYEKYYTEQMKYDTFTFDEFKPDFYDADFISILRRGVIGVHKIGYYYN